MVATADQNLCRRDLLLVVTLQTQRRIALGEHLGIYGAVNTVANRAPLPDSIMFESMGSPLGGMATQAVLRLRDKRRATTTMGGAFVRRMAISAGKIALGHGMMAGQVEFAADIAMALETSVFNGARRSHRRARAEAVAASGM